MHNPALHQEATVANQIKILNPPGAVPAQGLYSQAAFVPAGTDTYHIAGQVSVDQDGTIFGATISRPRSDRSIGTWKRC